MNFDICTDPWNYHLSPDINHHRGNSLTVQWLGLQALTAEGPGLIPGQGSKIPQASQSGQNKEKENHCRDPAVKHFLTIQNTPLTAPTPSQSLSTLFWLLSPKTSLTHVWTSCKWNHTLHVLLSFNLMASMLLCVIAALFFFVVVWDIHPIVWIYQSPGTAPPPHPTVGECLCYF